MAGVAEEDADVAVDGAPVAAAGVVDAVVATQPYWAVNLQQQPSSPAIAEQLSHSY